MDKIIAGIAKHSQAKQTWIRQFFDSDLEEDIEIDPLEAEIIERLVDDVDKEDAVRRERPRLTTNQRRFVVEAENHLSLVPRHRHGHGLGRGVAHVVAGGDCDGIDAAGAFSRPLGAQQNMMFIENHPIGGLIGASPRPLTGSLLVTLRELVTGPQLSVTV